MTVESEPGRGSSFTIFLPAAAEAATRDQGAAGTVLLAEDEPALRKLARLILEEDHYRVLEARNGREALELAQRHAGAIHLLLTDIVLPELNGPDLVARLEQQRPDMRVVYMSGYADSRLLGRGLAEQAGILRKPFDPDQLRTKIKEALRRTA